MSMIQVDALLVRVYGMFLVDWPTCWVLRVQTASFQQESQIRLALTILVCQTMSSSLCLAYPAIQLRMALLLVPNGRD